MKFRALSLLVLGSLISGSSLFAAGPGSPATPVLRAAAAAVSQRDFAQAQKLLREARQLDPSAPGVDYQLATVAFAQGQLEEAKTCLNRSLARRDAVADSNNLLGAILLRENDLPAAISCLQAASEADPKMVQPYVNLASAYRLNFEPLKAVPVLRTASGLNPAQRSVYEFRTRLALLEAGETNDIQKQLSEKLAAGEVEADWLLTAAALDLRQGRTDQAAVRLEQARQALAPDLFKVMLDDRAFKAHLDQPKIAAFYQP